MCVLQPPFSSPLRPVCAFACLRLHRALCLAYLLPVVPFILGLLSSDLAACPYCGGPPETEVHLLWDCPRWQTQRAAWLPLVQAEAAQLPALALPLSWLVCLRATGLLPAALVRPEEVDLLFCPLMLGLYRCPLMLGRYQITGGYARAVDTTWTLHGLVGIESSSELLHAGECPWSLPGHGL